MDNTTKAKRKKSAKRLPQKAEMPRSMSFQAAYLDDISDQILIEKSRQIGMSEYTALKAVRACIMEDAKYDWWVCSRDEDAAKLFVADCKAWAAIYGIAAAAEGVEVIEETNVYKITFASGKSINALSSNPDVLAGKRGCVVLDEFALHKDQQGLIKVSSAVTQWGGQRIIISTHRGKQSVFNTLITAAKHQGNPMGWSLHRITLEDACDAGIVERINAKSGKTMSRAEFIASCRAKCITEADFLEEYMCVPQDSAGQLVGWDVIARCTDSLVASTSYQPEEQNTNPMGLGVDVARKLDIHGYVVAEELGGRYVVRVVDRHSDGDKSWESRDARLDSYMAWPNIRRAMIDATGIGDKYVYDAQKRWGFRVVGIQFNNTIKAELAEDVARLMESGKIVIPDHEQLKRHIAAIARGYTPTGLVKYDADRSEDGHADLFWSFALAIHALIHRTAAGAMTPNNARAVALGSHTRKNQLKIRRLTKFEKTR